MIHFKTHLDKLNWCIECFVTTDNLQLNKIMCKLEKLGCSDAILTKAFKIMDSLVNTGFAYSNTKAHKSIMVINMATSMEEFINTYNHEKNHIEMHICEEFNIDPFSEEASDLSGYVAQTLYLAMLHNFE